MTAVESRKHLSVFRADQLAAAQLVDSLVPMAASHHVRVWLQRIAANLRLYAAVPDSAKEFRVGRN